MDSYWLTWTEIKERTKERDLVFYGRSEEWIPKSLKKVSPKFIVDGYNTDSFDGMEVKSPDKITNEFIVITSGSYEEIARILTGKGYFAGKDFAACPEYMDWYYLEQIKNHEQSVYVACSDRVGGGIFKYDLKANKYNKIAEGAFRQMVRAGKSIYAIEYVKGILYEINEDRITNEAKLNKAGYCGLAYDESRKEFLLINAIEDTITAVDQFYKHLWRIHYSQKGPDCHHLNDITIHKDKVYVSYFSHSGNWRNGIFDGGISEFDLDYMHVPGIPIVTNLWKPHSITMIDGDISFVDSMRGDLYITTQRIEAKFQGFIRGLTQDESYVYVGQSENKYMTEKFGRGNTMLNAGFYLYSRDKKVSRFYSMPDIMNVHDLLI